MDRIVVPDLSLRAKVGVSGEERSTEQEILLDVELHLDLQPAGRSDDLSMSVDYEAVCETLAATARSRPFRLIEAVAEEAARVLLERFPVREVRVRVRKPGALPGWGAPHAAVEVWRRSDG